jgi:S1-C subfamily serine protease
MRHRKCEVAALTASTAYQDVVEDTPADRAGLRVYDVVTNADGRDLHADHSSYFRAGWVCQ